VAWQIAVFNGGTTMNLRNRDAGDPDSARGLSFISINTSWDSATEGRILFKPPGDNEESTIEFRTMIDLATGRRYLDVIEGSAFKAGTYKWVRAQAVD
jgi:hypothetical protein